MKAVYKKCLAIVFLICVVFTASVPTITFASSSLDSVENGTADYKSQDRTSAMTDALKGANSISDEDMAKAQSVASPFVSLLGQAGGVLMLIVAGALVFMSALDLLYITVPFTRNALTGKVTDTALQCIAAAGGQQGQQGQQGMQGMQGMHNMQGGYGMQGGFNQQGMQAGVPGQQGQQQQAPKSAVSLYLKRRTGFVIFTIICIVLLSSSALTDCGLNIAELAVKVFNKVTDALSTVSI